MFQQMKKRIKNEKGLTLIELLAVIVILAIISAIAIPAIGNIIDNSRVKAAKADAANVLNAAQIYFTENSTATTFTKTTAGYESYVTDLGSIETFTVTKAVTSGTKAPTTVATTGKVSGNAYTITAATIKALELDNGDTASDTFSWGAPATTTTTTTTP